MTSRRKKKSQLKNPHKKIIIAMEGNKTEPDYFNKLKIEYKKSKLIIPLDRLNTNSDPKHVINQLNDYKKDNDIDVLDELWLIIDTENPDNRSQELLSEIADECETKNYRLGMSNPCFEIWLILHYEDSDSISKTAKCGELKTKWKEIKHNKRQNKENILDFLTIAVNNAEKLDIDKTTRYPNTIGTRVYKLIKSILDN